MYYYKQGTWGKKKDSSTERKSWQVYLFVFCCCCFFGGEGGAGGGGGDTKKTMSWGLIWRSPQRGSVGEKGKVVPCRRAEDRKGLGINSGKSIVRNPETETESIRRAESTGGCVNLNTVTEIRRSSDRGTFISRKYSVFLAQNSLWDWEPANWPISSLLQGYKDIYSPVTLKCIQKLVLETINSYSALRSRHSIAISHE